MRREMARRPSIRDAPGAPRRPVRGGPPLTRRAGGPHPRGARRFIGPSILGAIAVAIVLSAVETPPPASAGPEARVAALTSAPATPSPTPVSRAAVPRCTLGDEPAPHQEPDEWASTILDTTFTLPPDYTPTGLVPVTDAGIVGRGRIRKLVIDDLAALASAASADGASITVDSAYRSYDQQALSYSSYVKGYGEDSANVTVARPGHSEHQLGTTLDFAGDLDWLAVNAPTFGFVMSYPEARSPAHTCYRYEAWHFRYVGRERAALVQSSGLSLREWLWVNGP